MLWIEDKFEKEVVDALSSQLSVSHLLTKFLLARGITQSKEAINFISPRLAHLSDPFEIPGMTEAVKRVVNAIENKENILLIGDYDVDGITSTVIVKKNLISLGLTPYHVTPKRKSEGYGLTQEVLDRGLQVESIDLVIALDCGTNSIEESEFLSASGIDLIVIDHHQSKGPPLTNAIQVNPHLHDDHGEPWRLLCTAGLAFKLIHGILKNLRQQGVKEALELNPKDSLALAGLGTIADLVPLCDENRILATFGLKYLFENPCPGLQAILQLANLHSESDPSSEDIAFKIAPRINACGRLDDADVATSLLLETDHHKCKSLALRMNQYNEERKSIESNLSEDALLQAKEFFMDRSAVVVCGQGKHWNPGVVGIVAGKLANALGKPCIVLAQTGSECKGSGRGVQGVDLVQSLDQCKELLDHWGGHPAAVGLSLSVDNLELFKDKFVDVIETDTGGSLPESSIRIAAVIKQEELQDSLLSDLNNLAPFGQKNPEPILALHNIRLPQEPRKVGNGEHFQFSIQNGKGTVSGIAWNMSDRIPPHSTEIDLAFRFRWNSWNGRKTPQMILEDWKLSS